MIVKLIKKKVVIKLYLVYKTFSNKIIFLITEYEQLTREEIYFFGNTDLNLVC